MKTTEIKTKTCIVVMDKQGIVHKTVRPNSHLDAAAIRESDEIAYDLTKGEKALILYDARPSFTLTDKAMEYLHENLLSDKRIASAIVSDKPGIRLLGEYFKNSQPEKAQIRVFKTMKEATKWLLGFKRKAATNVQKSKHPVKGSITTSIARVEVGKDNVAYKRVSHNAHIDLPSLKKSFKETVAFLGNEKRLMMYDLRPHFTITDDALDYVIEHIMGNHGIATAILAKTIGVFIMADYAIKIKKIKSPLKVFSEEADALKWLASQKKALSKAAR